MECYVCTDIAYTLSPCDCKNLYLCQECYAKLLAYDNKHCGICLKDFPLPDIEAPEVIIEKPRRETISIWYPIICRSSLRPHNSCDFYFEPFRHFVLTLFIMNVVKYCFSPSKYIPAVYMPGDYVYWVFAIVIYFLLVMACRSTHENERRR